MAKPDITVPYENYVTHSIYIRNNKGKKDVKYVLARFEYAIDKTTRIIYKRMEKDKRRVNYDLILNEILSSTLIPKLVIETKKRSSATFRKKLIEAINTQIDECISLQSANTGYLSSVHNAVIHGFNLYRNGSNQSVQNRTYEHNNNNCKIQ